MKKILSIVLVMCLAVSLFAGCSSLGGALNEAKIVGTWEGEVETGFFGTTVDVKYTFEKEGKGSMPLLNSGISLDVNFNYTIEEDILTIKTDSDLISQTYVYTMAFEGDTLTLTDEAGDAIVLTKAE